MLFSISLQIGLQCSVHNFPKLISQACMYKIQIVIESSVVGPESVPTELVKVALAPIALVGESHQYPPVNWASILSPLMRLNFGKINSFLLSFLYLSQGFFTNTAFKNFRAHFRA